MTIFEWVVQYAEKFGDKPTIFGIPEDEAIAQIQAALKSGEPIPEPDIPKDAVI